MICKDSSKCSASQPTSNWMCDSCIQRLALESAQNFGEVFTDEQKRFIEEWLDENKDLMDNLED